MEPYSFCTHFDINYVPYAIALHSSLTKQNDRFRLYMFCMCDASYDLVSKLALPNVVAISHRALEQFFPSLSEAKTNRTKAEYFFTCSPAICSYVLKNYDAEMITYLDADLYFFNSYKDIFLEMANKSIGIIEHKFSWTSKQNIVYGKFNVGWVSFRNDEQGASCLDEWLSNCIEWCYQKLEGEKYGDQKYLNSWPEKYSQTHIIKHIGANVATWNVGNYKLKKINNVIYVDDMPLIFYHFANLRQIDGNKYKTNLSKVLVRTKGIIKHDIYAPYCKLLNTNSRKKTEFIKSESLAPGPLFMLIKLSRKIREWFFPDVITI